LWQECALIPYSDTRFTDILFSPDNCFLPGRWPKGYRRLGFFLCLGSQGRALIHSDESRFLWPTGRFSPDAHFVAISKTPHVIITCWTAGVGIRILLLWQALSEAWLGNQYPNLMKYTAAVLFGWKVALLLLRRARVFEGVGHEAGQSSAPTFRQ